MSIWDVIADVLKISLPAGLCILVAYLVFRSLHTTQRQQAQEDMRTRAFAAVIPLKIAAYERAMLFLSRIQPEAIVLRQEPAKLTALQMKQLLITDIRAEYDHNAVQQLYVSERSWGQLMAARDHVLNLIISAGEVVPDTHTGIDLAAKLLDLHKASEAKPIEVAIKLLKQDVAKHFA